MFVVSKNLYDKSSYHLKLTSLFFVKANPGNIHETQSSMLVQNLIERKNRKHVIVAKGKELKEKSALSNLFIRQHVQNISKISARIDCVHVFPMHL